MLRSLVLFCNENGEEQQALVEHPESVDLGGANFSQVWDDFNDAGGVYIIGPLAIDGTADRPDVTDGYGQEVPCRFLTVG